ncbi:MAG TPA: acetylxylan esterase, partial [Caldithrix sp.]|nr:acetylxylan esterase [Caldithrix sp.]
MKRICFFSLILVLTTAVYSQNVQIDSSKYPSSVTFTAEQDHENMMNQLGITSLRPGPSGNESAPNHANYDESTANPCPQLPDVLTTKGGVKVTSAEMWWEQRRPELVNDFEREIYGKLPENVPHVNWTVKITDREFVGRIPVIAKQLVGHVDNSEYPLINVDINMILVLPVNVKGPVPVLIMFGRPSFPSPTQPSHEDMERINTAFKEMLIKSNPEMEAVFNKYPAYSPVTRLSGPNFFAPPPDGNSPPTEQLLAAGWGYATIDPSSIQADNGAGLTRGVIGLANKGQPRK